MKTIPPAGSRVVLAPTPEHERWLLDYVLTPGYWAERHGVVTATMHAVNSTHPPRVILKDFKGLPKNFDRYWWPVECMELEGFNTVEHFI